MDAVQFHYSVQVLVNVYLILHVNCASVFFLEALKLGFSDAFIESPAYVEQVSDLDFVAKNVRGDVSYC